MVSLLPAPTPSPVGIKLKSLARLPVFLLSWPSSFISYGCLAHPPLSRHMELLAVTRRCCVLPAFACVVLSAGYTSSRKPLTPGLVRILLPCAPSFPIHLWSAPNSLC